MSMDIVSRLRCVLKGDKVAQAGADEIERLRAELAASRHELEGAKKAANAQARIIESLQQQRAHLNAQRDQWIEARGTLDSERAANAVLTEELAASREREARMREMIDCRTCRNYTRDGCIQTAQCVDGDGYRRATPVRFWSAALRGEVK